MTYDAGVHSPDLADVLRPEVAEFATAMETKLRKNDHKTGWKDQPIEAHIKLLRIEMMEFDVALEFLGDDVAAKECVDIANFALIIRDKLKARIAAKTQPNPMEQAWGKSAPEEIGKPVRINMPDGRKLDYWK